ncbi:MAG TPA: Holliday junction resolvase RuvX [Lachnospiraceae bacterium]|nr:Holliday junction resolvase RuvX [Lachnospiraceae bacterium]
MRKLGLDYGSKTVGVAVTDGLGWTAQGVEIIRRKSENKLRKTYARIKELIEEYEVDEIILGYPVMLSGDEGDRVAMCRIFKEGLEKKTGLPVVFWDERLTTVEANEIMNRAGIPKKDWKEYVDMIAAQLILQGYLDRQAELEHRKEVAKELEEKL